MTTPRETLRYVAAGGTLTDNDLAAHGDDGRGALREAARLVIIARLEGRNGDARKIANELGARIAIPDNDLDAEPRDQAPAPTSGQETHEDPTDPAALAGLVHRTHASLT